MRWAYVQPSLLTKILGPSVFSSGYISLAECGQRCANSPSCSQAVWFSPWQPCYEKSPIAELISGGDSCPAIFAQERTIFGIDVCHRSDVFRSICKNRPRRTHVTEEGNFALFCFNPFFSADDIQEPGINQYTFDRFGIILSLPETSTRYWNDPFIFCNQECQQTCGNGAEFMRLVGDDAGHIDITLHGCPNLLEVEVVQNNLDITFVFPAFVNCVRLRKISILQISTSGNNAASNDANFKSMDLGNNEPSWLTSCVFYANATLNENNWKQIYDDTDRFDDFLGVVSPVAEPEHGFGPDSKIYDCIPCSPDPLAAFPNGRVDLDDVVLVSKNFYSECPGIRAATAPLLYPDFPDDVAHDYRPRSPYLETLTIPTTSVILDHAAVTGQNVSTRTTVDGGEMTIYQLQPCDVDTLVVQAFQTPFWLSRVVADSYRGCLMKSVEISKECEEKGCEIAIENNAFADTPNLKRVRLGSTLQRLERGAFFGNKDSVIDLYVGAALPIINNIPALNENLSSVFAAFNVDDGRKFSETFIACDSTLHKGGCFPEPVDLSSIKATTAVGVSSAACGPGVFNMAPVYDVKSSELPNAPSEREDHLGMTRIKIARGLDTRVVQTPIGSLGSLCRPHDASIAPELHYGGFPAVAVSAPVPPPPELPWMAAHIPDPVDFPAWATLVVGLGSAVFFFGGGIYVGRKRT